MKELVLQWWRVLRNVVERIGRVLQNVTIAVGLFFLYLVGVGLTRLLMSLFVRKHLQLYKFDPDRPSYWKDAEGYGPDEKELLKQV